MPTAFGEYAEQLRQRQQAVLHGRGTPAPAPTFNRFLAGQGGVEAYPDCYKGRFQYCGWQLVGGSGDIAPFSPGTVSVLPIVSEHFDVRAIYMFGIDPTNPSTNLRFTIGAITVGGQPQYANNDPIPTGIGDEILSDCFNRSDQPVMVSNWGIISTAALGSPLVFDVFNLNAAPLRIFIALWGNAMTDAFVKQWKTAGENDESLYIFQALPIDAPTSFEFVTEPKSDGRPNPKRFASSSKPKRRKKKKRHFFGLGRMIGA